MGPMSELCPLPQENGLDPAKIVTPPNRRDQQPAWNTLEEWLEERLGHVVDVREYLRQGRFVVASGEPVRAGDPYRPHTRIWFRRELPQETEVPGHIHIVYQDARIVVVDKPPFLATIPRGQHVMQTALTRLRAQLALPELSPAHRLDRLTSGLLLFTTERKWRGPYQRLFQERHVTRTYFALAPRLTDRAFPICVRNHLHKRSGDQRVQVIADAEPNALSHIDLDTAQHENLPPHLAQYRLHPKSGKTHQLRQHMSSIGAPIEGDPLYPEILARASDDFSTPLQLLAARMEFIDPVDQGKRVFESVRSLPILPE